MIWQAANVPITRPLQFWQIEAHPEDLPPYIRAQLREVRTF
jgi:hypothetical protein